MPYNKHFVSYIMLFQTISAEKLKAFSVGNMNSVRQKSSITKKKEELEERKRVRKINQMNYMKTNLIEYLYESI